MLSSVVVFACIAGFAAEEPTNIQEHADCSNEDAVAVLQITREASSMISPPVGKESFLQEQTVSLTEHNGVPQDAAARVPKILKQENDRCAGSWKTDVFTPRLTTQEEMEDDKSKELISRYREKLTMHRKQWEYLFLLKVIDALPKFQRALGFAVGEEPTVSYLASRNVSVTATDLPPTAQAAKDWHDTNQLMLSITKMNKANIATTAQMKKLVSQEYVDMNKVEKSKAWKEAGTWDFVWSICSVEHVGTIRKALNFMVKSLELLKPGGTVLHTTEFNIASLDDTIASGGTVLFRKKDVDAFYTCAVMKGYKMERPCYDVNKGPIDQEYDIPPYSHDRHLRLEIGKFVSTCVGMVVRKPEDFVAKEYDCGALFDGFGIL